MMNDDHLDKDSSNNSSSILHDDFKTTNKEQQKKEKIQNAPLLNDDDDDVSLEVDEESKDFAKRLSSAYNHAATTTTTSTTSTNNNNNNNNTTGTSTPTITDEDYAAELQAEYNKEPQQSIHIPPDDDLHFNDSFEMPEVTSHSEDYHRFISLKRTGTAVKALSMLIFFFSIMTYFIQAWWLLFSGGIVMCPIGFYASHYLKRRLFLFFMVYLVIDIIFRFGFLFSHLKELSGFGIFISFVIDALEGYVVYFCLNFYKRMPSDGTITFRDFYLHDTGLWSF
ncbi:hypothetical protein DFA_01103 [Cavenderia fasciculata]|uniref:Transmembrane protein n=1 Tax=Cavenderia fasciculata TaxID=261658 RepID=F4PQW3_CACFS|nr:uncharacterized protein DFA_01103 [Cavenderia fasciculata]EGG21228.1 hypothetical protein DFA_01103 [Cavenderia fasciculata]|eukprot:XP_004359078.1 hypothetical protein DFA_01103 [Cavenderia fasciculata]